MFSLLTLMLACESPVPLPPKRNQTVSTDIRMVQVNDLRGYLSQPSQPKDSVAVLIQVDTVDDESRKQVERYPNQTVLVIDSSTSVPSATTYLHGLPSVQTIQRVCAMTDCSKLSGPTGNPH